MLWDANTAVVQGPARIRIPLASSAILTPSITLAKSLPSLFFHQRNSNNEHCPLALTLVSTGAPRHSGVLRSRLSRNPRQKGRMFSRIRFLAKGLASHLLLSRKLHSPTRCLQVCSGWWTRKTSGISTVLHIFQVFAHPLSNWISGQIVRQDHLPHLTDKETEA